MYSTPCSLRLFASKSAPLISAMFPPDIGRPRSAPVTNKLTRRSHYAYMAPRQIPPGSSKRRLHRLQFLRPHGVGIAAAPFGQYHLGILVEAGLVEFHSFRR